MTSAAKAEQILAILDEATARFVFPMLDNGYVYPAAARLSAYRDDIDWALVIETFGYSPRAGLPDVCVTTIASRLKDRKSVDEFVTPEAHATYLAVHPHDEQRYFYPLEEGWVDDDAMSIVPGTTAVSVRGRRVTLPEPAAYRAAGIDLEEPVPQVFELCRWLAATHRDAVLATTQERRTNVPDALAEVLLLDDWQHPDVADGERPSESITFRRIATLLAGGDVVSPAVTPEGNTHWRHWPHGGIL